MSALTRHVGAPPAGWSWLSLILLDIVLILATARIAANYYRDAHTTITGEGVMQKTLLGSRRVQWVDVHEFTMVGDTVHLPGRTGQLSINTAAYTEPGTDIIDRITTYIAIADGDDESDGTEIEGESSLPPAAKVI